MSSTSSLDFIRHKIESWYICDIEKAIKNNALYLALLGITVVIEVMGSIQRNKYGVKGEAKKNFREFLSKLGTQYVIIDDKLEKKNSSLYDCFRCGMVHNLLPKKDTGTIKKGLSQGIEYDDVNDVFNIDIENMFDDLKQGIIRLKTELEKRGDKKLYIADVISGTVYFHKGKPF